MRSPDGPTATGGAAAGVRANYPGVCYERRDHVAVITLARPDRLNAIDGEMAESLGEALRTASTDDQVRVVVVTGHGKAFSAGADLRAIAAGRSTLPASHPEWGFAGIVEHWIDKPVIAAVNGLAFGGGAELVLACDLAVMDENATIGFPEVTHGLVSAGGGLVRLAQQIPRKVALELLLTGRPISAARAAEVGLVNTLTREGQALDAAIELASTIAAHPPTALRETKRNVYRFAHEPDWTAATWRLNDKVKSAVFSGKEARAGTTRFAARTAGTRQRSGTPLPAAEPGVGVDRAGSAAAPPET